MPFEGGLVSNSVPPRQEEDALCREEEVKEEQGVLMGPPFSSSLKEDALCREDEVEEEEGY